MNCVQGFEIMADIIFLLYLIWTAIQDVREMQVVRYSHLLGILGVFLQFFLQKENVFCYPIEYFTAFLVLFFWQIAAGRLKLYGVADAIVFFMNGVFLLGKIGPEKYLLAFFVHQALAGIMLLAVQIAKRNIKGTKLLHSVPYIPYICFAFCLTNVVF